MACNHPMKAFPNGITKNFKTSYKIVPYSTDHIEDGQPVTHSYISPGCQTFERDYLVVACQKCWACRLAYAKEWANRCMLELGYHKQSWFITLTYDEKNVPVFEDEYRCLQTLYKKDLQDFMKRLRIEYKRKFGKENKLRFYAAGEYGDLTNRPHYHLIVFGLELPPDDLRLYKTRGNIKYYNSKFLSKIWTFGYSVLGEVTWDSCCYTARYVMKKLKGKDAKMIYESLGVEPEFVVMSRRPGIANQYFLDHAEEIYKTDNIFISKNDGALKCKPSKYYDNLYAEIHPENLMHLKMERDKVVMSDIERIERETKLRYDQYCLLREQELLNRTKALVRHRDI